jgi:hypothetical protein
MMPTEKLNLPTITGNLSIDVQKDLNALALAVDDKAGAANGLATLGADGKVPGSQLNVDLSPIQQELTAHQADDATDAHNAGNISFVPSSGMTATNVQQAINEVFQSGNNVKRDMVAALLAVDPALPITENSSWAEIETAAGQISTGDKLSGTVTSSSTGRCIVTGLTFLPNIILLKGTHSGNDIVVYSSELLRDVSFQYTRVAGNGAAWFSIATSGGYVNETGFNLVGAFNGMLHEWVAIRI